MGLKEQLLGNKKLNEEIQYAVATRQSQLSYRLGDDDDTKKPIDYGAMYDPFIKQYAEIQLALDNGSSENPSEDRRYAASIQGSVDIVKAGLENIISNSEVWGEVTQLAGLMGGVDTMGTPHSRYMTLTVLARDLEGSLDIKAVDGDINKLAWYVYDKDGTFIERMFVNKINDLSETQDLFISIPDTTAQNQEFKKTSTDIFEQAQMGNDPENQVLTGGVTETYRKTKANGEPDIYEKPLKGNLVQRFQGIDKDIIGASIQFNTEMDKITAGMIEAHESSDQVIAFNNNILSEVTNFYLQPSLALKPKQEKDFQEDYKEWYLKKEIADEMIIGEPYRKTNEEQPVAEEIVQEEVVEEQVV